MRGSELARKITGLFALTFLFLVPRLLSQENKVRVIAENAPIYAEASTYSYKIETVKKGTVLALFTTGPIKQTWFYVFYHSQRWNSKVTGFIQASLVERIFEKPEAVGKENKKQKAEIKKEEKAQVVPPKSPLLTMSLGYGPSLGSGIGGFIQLNTSAGFSFHIGAGYYPTSYFYSEYDWVKNRVLYSVGIKYYLPFGNNRIRPYLDLQYGGISIEAVRIVTEIWYYNYTYESIQKTLMGPSLLAGMEIKMGALGLNGALGLSYNTTEWDYLVRDYFLTGDVGLLIYF